MLWVRRDLVATTLRKPNIFLGGLLLVMTSLLLVVGQITNTYMLCEVSLVLSVVALAILLFGTGFARRFWGPLIYLFLMLQLVVSVFGELREPLKLLSAIATEDMLKFFGYVIYREGTYLHLPHIIFEVADECSGLNQVISSVALGIPMAFIYLDNLWNRVVIIVSSCVMGVVMNWVRIFLISIWNYDSVKENTHGPYGIYQLSFVFLAGVFVTLFIAIKLAEKERVSRQDKTNQVVTSYRKSVCLKNIYQASFVAVLIFAMTSFYLYSWKTELVHIKGGFSSFPMEITGYQGKSIKKLESPFDTDVAHDEMIREYANQEGETVKVYIGYFQSQDQEKELIAERNNWLHEDAETIELFAASPIQIKKKNLKIESDYKTAFFYYHINGRHIIERKLAKLSFLSDAIFDNRTNGAIIIVIFDQKIEKITMEQEAFLKQAVKESRLVLSALVPVNSKVSASI